MAIFRLCDIHGGVLDENTMNYATITAKTQAGIQSRDICFPCMGGSLRITLPNGTVVTGLGALTGDYSPAPATTPPQYEESPATKDKPKDKDGD